MKTLWTLVILCATISAQVTTGGRVTKTGYTTAGNLGGTIAVTATPSFAQTLLTYTAPSNSACNVHVYTDVGLTQEVNDTKESLYTGASNDQTRFVFNSGITSRQFVVGTVGVPENQYAPAGVFYPGIDGSSKIRSRALQNATIHYFQVACGTSTGTGSFATTTIPRGSTYPTLNPIVAAGTTWAPTMNEASRSERFIDPITGTMIRKVNLIADNTRQPISGPDAGNQFAYPKFKIQDSYGINLNLVNLQNNGGAGDLYGIPDDGSDTRFYGINAWKGGACGNLATGGSSTLNMNPSTLVLYGVCTDNASPQNGYITSCTLPASGNSFWDSSVPQNTFFLDNGTCTIFVDASPVGTRMHDFNSAFDATKFNCGIAYVSSKGSHTYLMISCLRGAQDTYAWIGVYDMSTHTVVAAAQSWTLPNMRWCGYHTPHQTDQSAPEWFHFTVKELEGGGTGAGQYTFTLNGSMDNSTRDVSITINNPGSCGSTTAPCPTSSNADTSLYAVQVGDAFNWSEGTGSQEMDYITAITDSTHITVHRTDTTLKSHPNGAIGAMTCGYQGDHNFYGYPFWWNFEQDTNGSSAAAANTARYFYWQSDGSPNASGFSGHESYGGYTDDAGVGNIITEGGWLTCKNYTAGSANPGPTNCGGGGAITISPSFNGVSHICDGNACEQHPTASRQYLASANEQLWGLDTPPEEADPLLQGTIGSAITGSLYPYTTAGFTFTANTVMSAGVLATSGAKGLQDISGPASSIAGAAGDNYKVCIALAANECRSGSVAGNVYFNIPGTPAACNINQSSDTYNAATDVCISTGNPYAANLVQIGFLESAAPGNGQSDTTGKFVRQVTQGLIPWHIWNGNNNTNSSPDGQWLMLSHVFSMATGNNFVMLAKAPPWPTDDGIPRNTFETKSVTIPQTASSTNAIVEMGYDPLIFGCSSRQEACAIGNVSQTRPLFETLEQSTLAGFNVTAGSATATLRGIPGKVMYYRTKQCSALPCTGGNLLSTSAVQTWVVP